MDNQFNVLSDKPLNFPLKNINTYCPTSIIGQKIPGVNYPMKKNIFRVDLIGVVVVNGWLLYRRHMAQNNLPAKKSAFPAEVSGRVSCKSL